MKLRSLVFFLLLPFFVSGQPKKEKLLRDLNSAKKDSDRVELFRELSRYYKTANFDSSVFYAENGIRLARNIHYRKGELRMLAQLASVHENHGNPNVARRYYLEALAGFKDLADLKGVAYCNNGLGVIEGRQGNLDVATGYFITALKAYEKIKDTGGILQTYIKLGAVNEHSGNINGALKYYGQARELNSRLKDPFTEVNLLNNVGIVYAKSGQMQKALAFFEEGIKKSGSPELAAMHVNLLTNAGNAEEQLGDRAKALEYHNKSLKMARASKLPEEEARAMINIASAIEDRGPAASVPYLEKALKIAQRLGNRSLQAEIYEGLASSYQDLKNYKKALLAVKEQHRLLDSMFTLQKSREMANLQSAYELDKSKENIKSLERANEQRTYQRNVFIIAACLIFCSLILLLFYISKIKKLNRDLRESNQVKDKLFSIIGHDLRGPIGTVVQMLRSMEDADLQAQELKEIVSSLKKHSEASLGTLDTLLQWGKTQLQGIRVNKVRFQPESIINKNLSIFAASSFQKMISISISLPKGLELYADPDHFDFVIRNLLSNAIKFTYPLGKIEIKAVSDLKPGFVIFSVKDNGKGIAESDKRSLFRSFSTAEEGTSGEKGTGIGLVLCREFILANDGDLWVESKEGEGAVFFFSMRSVRGAMPSSKDYEQEMLLN